MSTPEQDENVVADTQTESGSEQLQNEVDYEKRFKDTQSAYTKSQQELKAAKAKLEALEKLSQPTIQIDEATQQELDDLKYSDPDAWRVKMNTLEQDAKVKHENLLEEVATQASTQVELERRANLLEQYNISHPNMPITDELIRLDVPNRITTKLEKGEISFDDFIVEVHNFLYTPKKVGDGNKVLNQPNLNTFGGGSTPQKAAVSKDIVASYKNEIY